MAIVRWVPLVSKLTKITKFWGWDLIYAMQPPSVRFRAPRANRAKKKYENYSEPHRVTSLFKAYQILNVAYCLRFLISKAVQKLLADKNVKF